MNKSLILFLLLSCILPLQAKQWTLTECIQYAIDHNITIQQQDNTLKQREIELHTQRSSRLPNLGASASENFSFGRGLTSENTYTNTNTSSTSLSLGTSMPIFTGGEIPNRIKMASLGLEAATADLEKARNDISVKVAAAYMEILYDMEIHQAALRQMQIDSLQVNRIKSLLDAGKASAAELSQQQATLAQSNLKMAEANANLQLAVLALTQLLELPTPDDFTIVPPAVDAQQLLFPSPQDVYNAALAIKPEIRAEKLRVESAEKNILVQQAALYPSLSFSAGLGSNYYKTSGIPASNFFKQFKNNFSQYVGLSLNVPIFNRYSSRNSVKLAQIDRDNSLLQLLDAKKNLYKEIQQVYYNARNSQAKYQGSLQAEKAGQDAFTLVRAKYENGKANITEYNESKNNLLKAKSDLAQSRYETLYYYHLMRFYRGEPISF